MPTHRTAQPRRGNLGSRGNLLLSKGNCFSIHDSFAFFPHLWRQTPTPTHRTAQPLVCCLKEQVRKRMTCRTCVLSFLPHSLPPLLPHSDSPALLPPASLLPSVLPCLLRCAPACLLAWHSFGFFTNVPHRTVPGRGNIFPQGRTFGPNFLSRGQPSAISKLEK